MKYLGTITSGLDLVNKNYVDDNVPTKTSDLTNDSGFSSVSFTRYTTSGTNIADIEIDGTTTKIYAPTSGGGGGVTDYDQLTSRPQINSTTLTGDKSSSDLGLADEVHTHTKSEITDFPSLATVATTGDYDDLSDKPTIPTKVSDLNNDSGFISADSSGNVSLLGSITAEGHDSPIGYRPTRQTGSYSLASGTSWVTVPASGLARTTLSQGVWIIQAQAIFESNSTGRRALRIYDVTTSEYIGRSSVTQQAVNGATTNLTTMAIISLTASNALTLQIAQNSGAARNVDLTLHAVRIA